MGPLGHTHHLTQCSEDLMTNQDEAFLFFSSSCPSATRLSYQTFSPASWAVFPALPVSRAAPLRLQIATSKVPESLRTVDSRASAEAGSRLFTQGPSEFLEVFISRGFISYKFMTGMKIGPGLRPGLVLVFLHLFKYSISSVCVSRTETTLFRTQGLRRSF